MGENVRIRTTDSGRGGHPTNQGSSLDSSYLQKWVDFLGVRREWDLATAGVSPA